MRTKTVIAAALSMLALAACSGTTQVTQPSQVPGATISFAPGTTSPASPVASGVLPTSSPGAATGNLLNGTATVHLSGALQGDRAFTTLAPPAVFSPPPGAMAVVWSSPAGTETVSITGGTFTGTQLTSPTLTLTLDVLNGADAVLLTSNAGQCSVTIDEADAAGLRGSFTCSRLTAETGGLSVDAAGEFSASG